MKILQVGQGEKERKTEYHIKRALLELGHTVYTFNDRKFYSYIMGLTNNFFKYKAKKINPDAIIFSKATKLSLSVIKEVCLKYPSIMWYFDANIPFDEDILKRAKLMDIFYITNNEQIEELREKGVKNPVYLPQACGINYEIERSEYKYDISFIGSNNGGPSSFRTKLLTAVGEKYDMYVWGGGWGDYKDKFNYMGRLYGRDYAEVCLSSKILFAVRSNDKLIGMNGYFSDRVWLTIGYGGFLLCQYAPGMEKIFKHNEHIVYYNSLDEALEYIKYYLKNDDKREKIAKNGKELIRNKHTYKQRLAKILGDIKNIQK